MSLLYQPPFYVFLALAIFIAILIWKQVPALLARALDARAAEIKAKLDTAEALRREAEALLKSQIERRAAAETEAAEIIAAAKAEAQRSATEAKKNFDDQMQRRAQAAMTKIAQAEAQAIAEVKALVADIAVSAAGRIIAERLDGPRAAALVDASIRDIAALVSKGAA